MLRGPAGLSRLRGVAREDLERVLAEIDGERTATEICRRLPEYEESDVLRLLRRLERLSEVAGAGSPAAARAVHPPPDPSRWTLLGGGALADRIGEILDSPASASRTALENAELVVIVLEDAPYEELFERQRACLRAGVPSLFVTVDPDGVRIGPSTIPGAGPCLACAQIAGFRALGLDAEDLVAAVASFRTGSAGRQLEPAAREAAREARALLAGGRPELLTSVRLLSATGSLDYAVTPAPDCPLCGSGSRSGAQHPLAGEARRELIDRHRRAPRRIAAAEDGDRCTSVGIVGGGTAGYLTAMALKRKVPGLTVTLIESSALPVIGVGEATTPLMPQFLHLDLRLDVHELFREVQPTLKLGIRFEWGSPEAAFHYPFGPVHVLEPGVYDRDLLACSPSSLLMAAGALPLFKDDGEWRSGLGVDAAYHLDNRRFVRYLKRQARRMGVETVDARIGDVELAGHGETGDGETVTALVADDGRRFAFDLYVDCSGFRSLLLGKALGSPFLSWADSLPADRALVARVPSSGRVQPYTLAETMSAGWCWSTPQRDADHRGYVFCSAFQEPEDAEREMRRANLRMGETRLIRFRAGRHRHFWRGNVVAMGNAYGFVEPLESTALHMLIRQIGLLTGAFPLRPGERGIAHHMNRKVGAWWDYLQWFLALHYRYNRRLDTPFWRHCRRHADVDRHAELIELYRERGPLSYQPLSLDSHAVPDPLWGAEGIDLLLLGQGVPCRLPRPATSREEWQARTDLYRQAAERALPQAEALGVLDRRPELLDSWIAAFERVGPAFRVR